MVSYDYLEKMGSVQWPCNEKTPLGSPIMHVDGFVRGKGKFIRTEYVATDERTGPRFPLLLTTGRILSQYNVGAQTRRTDNVVWHAEDRLEIHPHDAEQRGMRDGDWVKLPSRSGDTTLRALITDRVAPGVVYTTFHHPDDAGERHHHRLLRLGDQLPGIQGDGRAGLALERPVAMAGRLRRTGPPVPPDRRQAGGGGVDRCMRVCSIHPVLRPFGTSPPQGGRLVGGKCLAIRTLRAFCTCGVWSSDDDSAAGYRSPLLWGRCRESDRGGVLTPRAAYDPFHLTPPTVRRNRPPQRHCSLRLAHRAGRDADRLFLWRLLACGDDGERRPISRILPSASA